METKQCKYELCKEEFEVTRKDKEFCCRECKSKHRNRIRYKEDPDFRMTKIVKSVKNKKKVNWVRPGELTEEQLEHLREIKPELFI